MLIIIIILVRSILMIKNGLLMNDPNIIPVNIFGFVLNFIYFLIFYFYTHDSVNKHFFIKT